jgi:hypothetical protein
LIVESLELSSLKERTAKVQLFSIPRKGRGDILVQRVTE